MTAPDRLALDRLPTAIAATYFEAPEDAETRAWLGAEGASPHGRLKTAVQRVARRFMSDFEANARLGMYSLHLGGSATYRMLLQRSEPLGALLDVGAGTGEVTAKLAPLFGTVTCTETSPAMARLIRRRGFRCEVLDLVDDGTALGTFDAVALLNVLDRTSRPQTLLDRALSHLDPQGTLILASPLPARPHVDVGGASADPDEDMGGAGDTFEEALLSLDGTLFQPRGLRIERWTRLPYRSQGDRHAPRYEHDDVLMTVRRLRARSEMALSGR